MYELIKLLFIEKGFRTYESNEGFKINHINTEKYFFAINCVGRKEYYLVIFLKNIDSPQLNDMVKGEYVRECFDAIKLNDNLYVKEMDKNSSIIFCIESDLLDVSVRDDNSKMKLELLKKTIYEVEEDPYFFKKYVLSYSKDQVDELSKEVTDLISTGRSVTDYLQLSLNNTEMFVKYKENPQSQKKYDLICKIFIKLPFLKLTNLDMGALRNLKEKIYDEHMQQHIDISNETISYLSEIEVGSFELKDLDELIKNLG